MKKYSLCIVPIYIILIFFLTTDHFILTKLLSTHGVIFHVNFYFIITGTTLNALGYLYLEKDRRSLFFKKLKQVTKYSLPLLLYLIILYFRKDGGDNNKLLSLIDCLVGIPLVSILYAGGYFDEFRNVLRLTSKGFICLFVFTMLATFIIVNIKTDVFSYIVYNGPLFIPNRVAELSFYKYLSLININKYYDWYRFELWGIKFPYISSYFLESSTSGLFILIFSAFAGFKNLINFLPLAVGGLGLSLTSTVTSLAIISLYSIKNISWKILLCLFITGISLIGYLELYKFLGLFLTGSAKTSILFLKSRYFNLSFQSLSFLLLVAFNVRLILNSLFLKSNVSYIVMICLIYLHKTLGQIDLRIITFSLILSYLFYNEDKNKTKKINQNKNNRIFQVNK